MKTQYEFINMKLVLDTGKTTVWNVLNNKSSLYLGEIKWHSFWRQYCFFPLTSTVFSHGCLEDINSFMVELKAERAKKKV